MCRPLSGRPYGDTAINRDLDHHLRQGRFREDLSHRLNVIHIHIPPLRERKEDIPLLAEHLLSEIGSKLGLPR